MKARLGRPDIARYAARFAVPAARADSPLRVTFLGVATLLIDDGTSAIMTDGFFSRPSLLRVLARPLVPDEARISACLSRAGVSPTGGSRLDAVVPVHSHYDHAQDSAVVARRTGAALVGGESTLNIGRGAGLPSSQLVAAGGTDTTGVTTVGAFELTHVASRHCPPDRFPGTISEPLTVPARVSAYRCGEAWSIIVAHRPSRRRMLVQGSAGFVPGALAGQHAEVVYLGVGQLGLRPESEVRAYWDETVLAVGARRAVLIHWDNFFRPLDQPLQATSYAADNLDETIRIFDELAARDGVEVMFPTVWQPEDPWR